MPKSWAEKYQTRKEVAKEVVDKKFADIQPGESMLIATPAVLEQYMRSIRKGKESDVKQFRSWAAQKFGADKTCPVTAGIFLRIVAEKQMEDMQVRGVSEKRIAPFWRMIGPKSPLLKKLSFDLEYWRTRREEEGLPT